MKDYKNRKTVEPMIKATAKNRYKEDPKKVVEEKICTYKNSRYK